MYKQQHPTPVRPGASSVWCAAAFTVALLCASPAGAAPITCGYGGSETASEGCGPVPLEEQWQEGGQWHRFNFGDYFFDLALFGVMGSGEVEITDLLVGEGEFSENFYDQACDEYFCEGEPPVPDFEHEPPQSGAYDCIGMVAGENGCVEFRLVASPSQGSDFSWTNYEFKIDWLQTYTSNANGIFRVLRDSNDDGFYDEDMCSKAGEGNYPECVYSHDPFIISGDTDFSTVIGVSAVPEPAALSLLGSGLIALWHQRRRARATSR
jgi:hypothetical protein